MFFKWFIPVLSIFIFIFIMIYGQRVYFFIRCFTILFYLLVFILYSVDFTLHDHWSGVSPRKEVIIVSTVVGEGWLRMYQAMSMWRVETYCPMSCHFSLCVEVRTADEPDRLLTRILHMLTSQRMQSGMYSKFIALEKVV